MLWIVLWGCGDAEKVDTEAAATGPSPVDTGEPETEPDTDPDADTDGYPGSEDCDDADASIYPGADESCDGIDNDCDGSIDEGLTAISYPDADGDGFGDPEGAVEACELPEGHVEGAGDCDDTDADIQPNAAEVCDGIDNDCDGSIDAGAIDALPFYLDADGDGYGSPDTTLLACSAPSGAVDNDLDCDDTDASTSPAGAEVCEDGVDNDCDGLSDCEDGECVSDGACEEDCTDGIDNDQNGDTDCEDATCWLVEACDHSAGIYVSILGGNMTINHKESRMGELAGWSWEGEESRVDATGVWGRVRVLPPGVSSWASATTSTVCSWGVDTVSGEQTSYQASGGIGEGCRGSRAGFWIDSGCRLSTSGFLPDDLAPIRGNVYSCDATWSGSWTVHIGSLWYSGSLLSSGFTSRSSPATSTADMYFYSEQTWYNASITGASSMLVYP